MKPIFRIIIFLIFLIKIGDIQVFAIINQLDSTKCSFKIDSISNEKIYEKVDEMPDYTGGKLELLKFFSRNFKYPNDSFVCCKIIVEFVIDSTGAIRNPRIIRGLQKDFDDETLRVIKLMPKWKAGKCDGTDVSVKMVMPFQIELR